jgi:hypothetical protein
MEGIVYLISPVIIILIIYHFISPHASLDHTFFFFKNISLETHAL